MSPALAADVNGSRSVTTLDISFIRKMILGATNTFPAGFSFETWIYPTAAGNLANIFDPEMFVIGGGLVEAGDVLFEPTRVAFADLVEAADRRPVISIVPAELGERAGAMGAAALACASD